MRIALELIGPRDERLELVKSFDLAGTVSLDWIAQETGTHRVRVHAHPDSPPGDYVLRLAALRTAAPSDEQRLLAQQLFADGDALHVQEVASSLEQALASYQQALSIWQSLGERRREAELRNRIALVLDLLNRSSDARINCDEAVRLCRQLDDEMCEAQALTTLGSVLRAQGKANEAMHVTRRALSLSRSWGLRLSEATLLCNLAQLHLDHGDPDEAINLFQEAAAVFAKMKDPRLEAIAANGLGLAYAEAGETQRALAQFRRAVAVAQAARLRALEVRALNNLASALASVGDSRGALTDLSQALALVRELGDQRAEASTLTNLGEIQRQLGDPAAAVNHLSQAIDLHGKLGNWRSLAASHLNAGVAYRQLGDHRRELLHLRRALQLTEQVGDSRTQAATMLHLGEAAQTAGKLDRALDWYRRALRMSREARDRSGEIDAVVEIASIARRRGNLDSAREHLAIAVNGLESQRSKIAEKLLRASHLQSVRSCYEQYIEVLMALEARAPGRGYLQRALEISERAHARGLVDHLREIGIDFREGADPSGKEGRPIRASEIQELLDENGLLLEYSLGDSRGYVWAVTRRSISGFELPGRKQIEPLSRALLSSLTERSRRIPGESRAAKAIRVAAADRSGSRQLAAMGEKVLGSVRGLLHGRRLLLVLDEGLNYIPFAALPARRSKSAPPLIAEHEIAYLPSASALWQMRQDVALRPPAEKLLAVVADPVFSSTDLRVSGDGAAPTVQVVFGQGAPDGVLRAAESRLEGEGPERLLHTRREANEIAALAPGGVLNLLDFDASRDAVLSPRLRQYRIVHLATHAVADPDRPELSGFALSLVDSQGRPQDGFVRLNDVYQMKLAADLVVLSGCETALGMDVRGEGLVGLSRGFIYAGAQRVMASLWKVDDAATAELMKEFYRQLFASSPIDPAAAMRAAQLTVRNMDAWQQPFFWASFSLYGD
jgi:CHAT domain-containing protein/tetratricopeptide (TPR) repeat protein